MLCYKTILDNQSYKIFIITPEDLSGENSNLWGFFVFDADYEEGEDKYINPQDAISNVSVRPFWIRPKDSYWFPAWIIESLEVNGNVLQRDKLKASSFGMEFLEYVAKFLRTDCKTDYIFVKTTSQEVSNLLLQSGLYQEQTEISQEMNPLGWIILKLSALKEPGRSKAAKETKGIHSLDKELFTFEEFSLSKAEITTSDVSSHIYIIRFNAKNKDNELFVAGMIEITVAVSIGSNGNPKFTIRYMPVINEAYIQLASADNFLDFICATIREIASIYKNANTTVSLETSVAEINERFRKDSL